eukprot:m.470014 g.470014  ORF g.470014 m.470014 type:complete len:428 (-) comp29330_c0_seq1:884-2167(-)
MPKEGGLAECDLCPFERLPNELVHHVLSLVGSRWVLTSVHAVCRRWRHISRTVPVNVKVVGYAVDGHDYKAKAYLNDVVPARMPYFMKWKVLPRDTQSEAFGNWLIEIVTRFCVQTFLDVYWDRTEHADARSMIPLTHDKLVDIVRLCSDLKDSTESLVMSMYKRPLAGTDRIVTTLATCCRKLVRLTLDGDRHRIQSRRRTNSDLRQLLVQGTEVLTPVGLCAVGVHCRRLEWLKLKDCAFAGIGKLSGCDRLTELWFSNCAGVDTGCLAAFGNACPRLRKLSLCGCTNVTDDGIAALFIVPRPCLNDISISDAAHVSDVGVKVIGTACPNLTAIYLSKVCLTDCGVRYLIQSCVTLKVVVLSSVAISDGAVWDLEHNAPSVRGVGCFDCPNLSIASSQMIRESSKEWVAMGCSFPDEQTGSLSNV